MNNELDLLKRLVVKERVDAHIVGGLLRDRLLGRETRDIDLVVSRGAVKLARAFAKSIKGAFVLLDAEAGCARVAKKKNGLLWTYDLADLRAPTLAKDLKKRDFTINTLTVPLASPEARPDPKAHRQAMADIKARTIRMAAPDAFIDDPLRMLRAYSLMAQLGFKIEPATVLAIKKQIKLIHKVSLERVREELFKIFASPRAGATLKLMVTHGVLQEVLPQLRPMVSIGKGGYHHLHVLAHSLEAVQELEKLILAESKDPDITAYFDTEIAGGHTRRALVMCACLLHDVGKPDTMKEEEGGRRSFHGHENVGRRIVGHMARQLKMSSKERYALEDMVAMHLRPGYLTNFKKPSERMVFRFMRDARAEAVSILLLSLADQYATRGPLTTKEDIKHHEEIVLPLVKTYFARKKEKPFVRLIDGNDLIKYLKLKPGPAFARILKSIDEAQHLGKVTTKAEALALASRLSE